MLSEYKFNLITILRLDSKSNTVSLNYRDMILQKNKIDWLPSTYSQKETFLLFISFYRSTLPPVLWPRNKEILFSSAWKMK